MPVDSFHWLPVQSHDERMAFLSRWEFPSFFSDDPAAFVALRHAAATNVTFNPHAFWNIDCERHAMQQADVNVSGPGVQRLAWQRACAPDLRPLDLWKRHAHDLHCAFGQCYCHKTCPFVAILKMSLDMLLDGSSRLGKAEYLI